MGGLRNGAFRHFGQRLSKHGRARGVGVGDRLGGAAKIGPKKLLFYQEHTQAGYEAFPARRQRFAPSHSIIVVEGANGIETTADFGMPNAEVRIRGKVTADRARKNVLNRRRGAV